MLKFWRWFDFSSPTLATHPWSSCHDLYPWHEIQHGLSAHSFVPSFSGRKCSLKVSAFWDHRHELQLLEQFPCHWWIISWSKKSCMLQLKGRLFQAVQINVIQSNCIVLSEDFLALLLLLERQLTSVTWSMDVYQVHADSADQLLNHQHQKSYLVIGPPRFRLWFVGDSANDETVKGQEAYLPCREKCLCPASWQPEHVLIMEGTNVSFTHPSLLLNCF